MNMKTERLKNEDKREKMLIPDWMVKLFYLYNGLNQSLPTHDQSTGRLSLDVPIYILCKPHIHFEQFHTFCNTAIAANSIPIIYIYIFNVNMQP